MLNGVTGAPPAVPPYEVSEGLRDIGFVVLSIGLAVLVTGVWFKNGGRVLDQFPGVRIFNAKDTALIIMMAGGMALMGGAVVFGAPALGCGLRVAGDLGRQGNNNGQPLTAAQIATLEEYKKCLQVCRVVGVFALGFILGTIAAIATAGYLHRNSVLTYISPSEIALGMDQRAWYRLVPDDWIRETIKVGKYIAIAGGSLCGLALIYQGYKKCR